MKPWDAIATQYPCDCACRHIHFVAELIGFTPMLTTRCKDLFFDLRWRLVRDPMRTRRAVMKTIDAFGIEAVTPLRCALTRDAGGLRDVRDGLAVLDTFNEQQAAMEREAGITVRHEDLSVFVKRQTPHQPKVLTYVKPSPTS